MDEMSAVWLISIVSMFLVPLSMVIIGMKWRKKPPEYRGMWFLSGYKTYSAQLSSKTWETANKLYGKWMVWLGFPLLMFSLWVVRRNLFQADFEWTALKCVGVQILFLIFPIIPVEIKLRREFDENGERKVRAVKADGIKAEREGRK